MSYWFYAETPMCSTCGQGGRNLHEPINMTSNVSGMWSTALGHPMRDLDGKRLGDLAVLLSSSVAHIKADPALYRKMEPSNGWGSYESALEILETLLYWAIDTADGVLRISS